MEEILDFLQKGMIHYQINNSLTLNEDIVSEFRVKLNLKKDEDIPIGLLGIFSKLVTKEPGSFYNEIALNEILDYLTKFASKFTADEIVNIFKDGIEYFFISLKSYLLVEEMIIEFSDISFDESFKNSFFRANLYTKIIEEILMNFYRFLSTLLSEELCKDYRNQDTLGKILPVLSKNGFKEIIRVDKNLRNAINHGNIIYTGNTINYRYIQNGKIESDKKERWEFDNIILQVFDLSSGILLGFLKFLSLNPLIFSKLITEEERINIKFDWLQLQFISPKTNIKYIEAPEEINQLNIHTHCSLDSKNKIIFSLFEILKMAFVTFPNFDNYFIGYTHERSISGFIRLSKQELEKRINEQFEEKQLSPIDGKNDIIFINDINKNDINLREHKYFVFPEIKNQGWYVKNIEICSIEKFKRIKCYLIFKENTSKNGLIKIIKEVTKTVKRLYTPPDPRIDVPYGNIEADAVFMNVFFKTNKRNSYNLFTENKSFICMSNYYGSSSVPRLKNGGVPISLWNQYKKNIEGKIHFAWNPKIKFGK